MAAHNIVVILQTKVLLLLIEVKLVVDAIILVEVLLLRYVRSTILQTLPLSRRMRGPERACINKHLPYCFRQSMQCHL